MTSTVRKLLETKAVTNVMEVVRVCMEYAEKTDLHGSDKSKIVHDLLSDPELTAVLPEAVQMGIQNLLDNDLLQPTIDLVIDASKGKMNFNKTAACCLSFAAGLFKKTA